MGHFTQNGRGIAVVCGATGHAGGAVVRSLLERGWNVRALTRKPRGKPAEVLASLGAEVIQADMNDPASLEAPFRKAYGTFSVQNGLKSGFDQEIRQGINVADAADKSGVRHVVYLSAGIGEPGTGVGSWDSKIPIEAHMKELGLPLTVLRPTAYMELMTDKAFAPAAGTWNLMGRLMGDTRPVPWIAVGDIGKIAALAFEGPDALVGKDIHLAGDVRTLSECRSTYEQILGRPPGSFPMPLWLFDRFTRRDLSAMWRWLRVNDVPTDTAPTRRLLPEALTVREWLEEVNRRPRRTTSASG